MKKLVLSSLLILSAASIALGQVRQTENTLKLTDGKPGERAAISDMSWLAGTWTGDGLGGVSDEVWTEPRGGVMMGMYRMTKSDKPVFYELLTMEESGGTLLIRLKHFSDRFVGWEEKDKTEDFKFVKKDGKRFYFEGMTFEPAGRDKVNIYLAISQKDGTVREEIFRYKRVK